VRINFYATLRQIVGGKTLDLEIPQGATVRQLLDEIIRAYPLIKRELFNENGELYGHVHVLVNGRDVPYLENVLDTVLSPQDIVTIFPAVGGG
jgi:molybdopterin synthase sulfur carrier subunit